MRRLREQMVEHEAAIELTEEAKELLVEKGYDPAMGARPLRRAIQRFIEDPLADFVLGRSLKPGSTIVVDRKDDEDEVDITVVEGAAPEDREKVTVPADESDGRGRAATTSRPTRRLASVKVAVVGGGAVGLACAYALAPAGRARSRCTSAIASARLLPREHGLDLPRALGAASRARRHGARRARHAPAREPGSHPAAVRARRSCAGPGSSGGLLHRSATGPASRRRSR